MSTKMIARAISAVLALGVAGASVDTLAETKQQDNKMPIAKVDSMEKCYGITKAGMNDCANANHGCSGEAKTDSDKHEWLFVPAGLCHKIVGGNTQG